MIIKYQNGNTWGSFDEIAQEVHFKKSTSGILENANKDELEREIQNYGKESAIYSEIYVGSSEDIKDYLSEDTSYHTVKAIDEEINYDELDTDLCIIICSYRKPLDFDYIVIITNQKVYQCNDDGKTIERLN